MICLFDFSHRTQSCAEIKVTHWMDSQWSGRGASRLSVCQRPSHTLYEGLIARGAINAPMTLKIRVEIRSESAVKTPINPGFQAVYQLPGRPRENKLCIRLRTVNAPIKTWLSGLLTHTIDAFTLLLIFHPHFRPHGLQLSKWFNRTGFLRQAENCFCLGFRSNVLDQP